MARGEYITPFSTNDRLNPNAHKQLSDHLKSHPNVGLVYADTYLTLTPHVSFEERAQYQGPEQKWDEFLYERLLLQKMQKALPFLQQKISTGKKDKACYLP